MADETSSERCYEQTEGEINDAGRAQRNRYLLEMADETSSETCYEQTEFDINDVKRAQRNKFLVEIIYFCLTTFVIVTITIAAVVNISRNNHVEIFISLLSTCIGVVLPQPAIRSTRISSKQASN